MCHVNVDWLELSFFIFFLLNFIISYLNGWKLNYIFCFFLKKKIVLLLSFFFFLFSLLFFII